METEFSEGDLHVNKSWSVKEGFQFGKKLRWARRARPAEWVLSAGRIEDCAGKPPKSLMSVATKGLMSAATSKKAAERSHGRGAAPAKVVFFSQHSLLGKYFLTLFYSGNMGNYVAGHGGFHSGSILRYFGR